MQYPVIFSKLLLRSLDVKFQAFYEVIEQDSICKLSSFNNIGRSIVLGLETAKDLFLGSCLIFL